jgi:uncharacterized membrane protein
MRHRHSSRAPCPGGTHTAPSSGWVTRKRTSDIPADTAFYTMLGGVIGALAAAVPGLIDFVSLTGARVRRLATMHLVLNLAVVGLSVVNLWLRTTRAPEATLPIVLSAIGLVLLIISGWLGGEMVYVHGVGVATEREIAITTEAQPHQRSA